MQMNKNHRKRKIFVIFIFTMLFCCLLAQVSFAASKLKKSASKPEKSAGGSYATAPFNDKWTSLPRNYNGHDISAVYKVLSKRFSMKKGEYETTEAFEKRKEQEIFGKPVIGNIKMNDQFAFIVDDLGKNYDADAAQYAIQINKSGKSTITIKSRRTGDNQLGRSVLKGHHKAEKRKRAMRSEETFSTDLAAALLYAAAGTYEEMAVVVEKDDDECFWYKMWDRILIKMTPAKAQQEDKNIRLLIVCKINAADSRGVGNGIVSGVENQILARVNKIILYNHQSGEIYKTVNRTVLGEEMTAAGDLLTDPATGMQFALVKGGCYQMGNTFNEGEKHNNEPVHEVCVNDFYMGKYEVTQGEWRKIMGENPSEFQKCGDSCPVEQVSWYDAQRFICEINSRSGKRYRLPTEDEWEYAARSGGKSEKWAGTSSESSLGDYGWYDKNSDGKIHPVGQKLPNGLGIYDMTGNVWEWCAGLYKDGYFRTRPRKRSSSYDTNRVKRGGCGAGSARDSYVARRVAIYPDNRDNNLGLRLVLPLVKK